MVQNVGGIVAYIDAAPLANAEDPAGGCIQVELYRPRDDIAPGVAPLAGKGLCESVDVESVAGEGWVERTTGVIRTDGARHASPGSNTLQENRRFRQTTPRRECSRKGPIFRESALPAAQQSSTAGALSGAVLNAQIKCVGAVETR